MNRSHSEAREKESFYPLALWEIFIFFKFTEIHLGGHWEVIFQTYVEK